MKNLSSIQRATDLQNPFPASGRRILRLQFWLVGCAVLLAFSSGVRANDSAFSGVGGRPKLMKGEHPAIAMQSEKIVIVFNGENYDTRVDFVFRNDGNATSVQMGFPESTYGDVLPAQKTNFLRFDTWVEGRKVSAKRIVIKSSEGLIDAYWLKTVSFAPRQRRHVRVEYRSPMAGHSTWSMHHAASYDFTGQNWKGKVERSDLEVRVREPGLWVGSPLWNYEPLAMNLKVGAKEAVFRKTWRNWQADGKFWFGLTRTVPFWMSDRSLVSDNMNRSDADFDPKIFAAAKTFRVSALPAGLPQNAEAPPAFTRNGVTYISLPHLKNRLEDFVYQLTKHRGLRPKVDLKRDEKTGVSTLVAGQTTLHFAPRVGSPAPILLRGEYDSTLYVPLASVARKLGLTFQLDPKNRLFDLKRGSWTEK